MPLFFRRKFDFELRALAQRALDREFPARAQAQFFDDGKPQTEPAALAAVRFIDRVKAVEDTRFVLFGNAHARIAHAKNGVRAAHEPHGERTALFVVADAVGNHVVDDFDEPLAARHHLYALFHFLRESDLFFGNARLERRQNLGQQNGEVYLVIGQGVAVDGGKVDDAADQGRKPVALADDGARRVADTLGRHAVRRDEFGKAADAGERRVHFVRDVGDKIVLRARRRHRFGDVGDEQHAALFFESEAETVIAPFDAAGNGCGLALFEDGGDLPILGKTAYRLVLFVIEQALGRAVDEDDV